MFTTLLRPENAVLYHRILGAVFEVVTPALAQMIAQGEAEGRFHAGDPRVAAETLLGLANGRRALIMAALAAAETDPETGVRMIAERIRAEEHIANRVLGLTAGSVDLLGAEDALRDMIQAWRQGGRAGAAKATAG
jgi:hypothetical protein